MVIGVALTASFRHAYSKQERLCAISAKQNEYKAPQRLKRGGVGRKLRLGRAMKGLKIIPGENRGECGRWRSVLLSDNPWVSPKIKDD